MRFFSRALLVVPLLVLCASAAHAQWSIVFRNGDFSGSQGVNGSTSASNFDEYYGSYMAASQLFFVTAPSGTGKTIANAKFKVYAHWNSYGPGSGKEDEDEGNGPPPPPRVFVDEWVNGAAYTTPTVLEGPFWSSTGVEPSVELSFDLPFVQVVQDNPFYKWRRGDRHRVVDNSSRETEVLIGEYDLKAEARATIPPREGPFPWTDNYGVSTEAQVGYGVTASQKGLGIESELDTTYYKEYTGSSADHYTRQPNKRKQDGSKKDDTVASYGPNHEFFMTTVLHGVWDGLLEDVLDPIQVSDGLGIQVDWSVSPGGFISPAITEQHSRYCSRRIYSHWASKDSMPLTSDFQAK